MTDEELRQEMEFLQSFKVPSSPIPKAPKKVSASEPKPKRRASWQAALGLDND